MKYQLQRLAFCLRSLQNRDVEVSANKTRKSGPIGKRFFDIHKNRLDIEVA